MQLRIISTAGVPSFLQQRLPPKLVEIFRPHFNGCLLDSVDDPLLVAYDARRRQYRADVILRHLVKETTGGVTLVITGLDVYVPDLNFVFGLCSGRAALVSIRRLDPAFYGMPPDRDVLWGRTLKEAVHEIGHAFGLSHCPDPGCVMSFSNSILDVDKKSPNFCGRCRDKLFTS